MNSNAVMSMNQELKVGMDSPDIVAAALIKFIKGQQASQHIGFPERFFAWLNRVFPSSVGSAIVKDLPTIQGKRTLLAHNNQVAHLIIPSTLLKDRLNTAFFIRNLD